MMLRTSFVALAAVFAAGLAGCSDRSTPTAVDKPANDAAKASPAEQAAPAEAPAEKPSRAARQGEGRERGAGGPLRGALAALDLTPAQRATLDDALGDLPARKGDAAPDALAKQVRAGTIDDASGGALADAKALRAIQTLHDTLTPAQRKDLVKKLSGGDGEHGRRGRGGLGFLRGVELKDGQREKIDKALADAGIAEAGRSDDREAALRAFEAEPFDAAKAAVLLGGRDGRVKALKVIVPLLDDAQRSALADRLERGPKGDHREGRPGVKRRGGRGRDVPT